MKTIRQLVRDRVIAELNIDRPMDVPEAGKRFWMPGQRLADPRLAVYFHNEPVVGGKRGPATLRVLSIGVQAAAAVEDPADADDMLEPILAWAVKVLGDTNLDNLAHGVVEKETAWESASGDLFYHQAVTIFEIEYQTKRADLTARQ